MTNSPITWNFQIRSSSSIQQAKFSFPQLNYNRSYRMKVTASIVKSFIISMPNQNSPLQPQKLSTIKYWQSYQNTCIIKWVKSHFIHSKFPNASAWKKKLQKPNNFPDKTKKWKAMLIVSDQFFSCFPKSSILGWHKER